MSVEATLGAALVTGLIVALALVPFVMALARRLSLYDHPTGWKTHGAPTPVLGGIAVLGGWLAASALFSGPSPSFAPILTGAVVLAVVGLLDDRIHLPVPLRLGAEIAAAALLWKAGIGWEISGHDGVNLLLTVAWVVGVINAVNLLDLMDGVVASTLAVAMGATAVLAGLEGQTETAVLAVALAGGCLGFLPFNLSGPARIFLGDTGSMPIGFLAAATTMLAASAAPAPGALAPLVASLLLALPLFDLVMRVFLRLRRRISLLVAGSDSIANRLRERLGSERAVSLTVAAVQAICGGMAVVAAEAGSPAIIASFVAMALAGIGAAYTLHGGRIVVVSAAAGVAARAVERRSA